MHVCIYVCISLCTCMSVYICLPVLYDTGMQDNLVLTGQVRYLIACEGGGSPSSVCTVITSSQETIE